MAREVDTAKLLGVLVDSHLTFAPDIAKVISKARQKLYGILKLRQYGVDTAGVYTAIVRPALTYAAPAWYTLLTVQSKTMLEGVQKTALSMILPELTSYEQRLKIVNLPSLNDFILTSCINYFKKILSDNSHRLYNLIPKVSECLRRSKRLSNMFDFNYRTNLRKNSFFNNMVTKVKI